ncbi:hypothetical protein [Agromyces seonyuensis]|uniref:Phosphotyrosine protein phosphatase I domain-containing protein n=1 Tax=Agromyces seonyuensis TaxID=2662446 RepID=A0A6I4NS10_9MICO|nr:hypothetical protein [Agromyces seonyuensis]
MVNAGGGRSRRGEARVPVPARPVILFVCTANQCRSPLARAIAEAHAEGMPVEFDSAGLLRGGAPMPRTGLEVAAESGLDLSEHRSRRYDRAEVAHYDLVLTMTREQAREILAESPELWPRVFTLKQFTRWADGRRFPKHADLSGWIDAAAADRQRTELLGSDPVDEIVDPVDQPVKVWRQVAEELEDHVDRLLAFVAPRRGRRRRV